MSEIVRASTPFAASRSSAARAPAASSGSTSSPPAPMRPTTSTVSCRSASGSGLGQMIQPASPPGTYDRAICSTWRNPSVVTRPTRAPLPSRIALVATVVPCSTCAISRGSTPAAAQTFARPLITPSAWSAGVEGVLARHVRPVSSSTRSRSVKVPPTSTPKR